MTFPSLRVDLPEWIDDICSPGAIFSTVEERVGLVLSLARANFEIGEGGPFGAAVFDAEGRLIAPGVNLVVPTNFAAAHAEIIAIGLAGKVIDSFDLGGQPTELVASTEPCAMCLGAVPWSGVRRLVCSARDEDASRIGFEEGDKPTSWVKKLERRGIEVVRDVQPPGWGGGTTRLSTGRRRHL